MDDIGVVMTPFGDVVTARGNDKNLFFRCPSSMALTMDK